VNWMEVSLTVNGELAEAVADVLARFAPNGVMTEQSVRYKNNEDEETLAEPIIVRAYLPADEKLEQTRNKLEEALFFLNLIQPIPAPVYTPIADRNWMEAWKKNYQPIPIGEKLIIVPAWLESPDENRIPIRIDPGMAFGTGTHPTTQLCLELLESYTPSDGIVIDVGCGSGILSIGALMLGARYALGVDIDESSIKASRENARANGISDDQFTIGQGSVPEILKGEFHLPEQDSSGLTQAPLVVVNILASVIVYLFQINLSRLVSPGGKLILSGILVEQSPSVVSAAREYGLKQVEERQQGDWVALVFANPDI
jgi:ribosomal protein L11 methyltransferase